MMPFSYTGSTYDDEAGVVEFLPFAGRSHYICNELGWEEVAEATLRFIETHGLHLDAPVARTPV